MKHYETIKIEIISLTVKDDILLSSAIGPVVFSNGAIDAEMDYANDNAQ